MGNLPKTISDFFVSDKIGKLNDYLRFIPESDREQYENICKNYKNWQDGIPFAISSFGEILEWTNDGYVMIYKFMENRVEVILKGDEFFHEMLSDQGVQNDFFELSENSLAINKYGKLQNDECYIYEPIPALGGNKDINSIKIGNSLVFLSWVVQMV